MNSPAPSRMPAEWEPHAATWLAWPHNRADWPGKFQPIPWVYAEIVRHLATGERVNILIQPGKYTADRVRDILAKSAVNLSRVRLHPVPTDRTWLRDSGPIFVRQGRKILPLHFTFNAWAKYPNHRRDAQVPAAIAKILNRPATRILAENDAGTLRPFVLEGGSIDVNGTGSLLTTEECLLSKIQQRNPGFSKARIEQTLRATLGIDQILWLPRGIAGDDTHGHIDDTARFVNPTTIALCVETNRRDPNFAPTQANLRTLRQLRTPDNKPFTLVELPLPAPVTFDGQRLPASYANFYIANAGILVPTFNDPNDARALHLLQQCFPSRPILPIYSRDLVWGLGTLHCLTQQEPAP